MGASAVVRSIITTVMELAHPSPRPVMESVLKDGSIVVVSVVINYIIMTAMVGAPKNLPPAMENVLVLRI